MHITLKLYASLREHLPKDAKDQTIKIAVSKQETVFSILDRFAVPRGAVHLVLLNGHYLDEQARNQSAFSEGDILAIWPPIAGG